MVDVIRRQLKAYHKAQGLRGNRLKREVHKDMVRAAQNRVPWLMTCPPDSQVPLLRGTDLAGQFTWNLSPQGHDYWRARCGW